MNNNISGIVFSLISYKRLHKMLISNLMLFLLNILWLDTRYLCCRQPQEESDVKQIDFRGVLKRRQAGDPQNTSTHILVSWLPLLMRLNKKRSEHNILLFEWITNIVFRKDHKNDSERQHKKSFGVTMHLLFWGPINMFPGW